MNAWTQLRMGYAVAVCGGFQMSTQCARKRRARRARRERAPGSHGAPVLLTVEEFPRRTLSCALRRRAPVRPDLSPHALHKKSWRVERNRDTRHASASAFLWRLSRPGRGTGGRGRGGAPGGADSTEPPAPEPRCRAARSIAGHTAQRLAARGQAESSRAATERSRAMAGPLDLARPPTRFGGKAILLAGDARTAPPRREPTAVDRPAGKGGGRVAAARRGAGVGVRQRARRSAQSALRGGRGGVTHRGYPDTDLAATRPLPPRACVRVPHSATPREGKERGEGRGGSPLPAAGVGAALGTARR